MVELLSEDDISDGLVVLGWEGVRRWTWRGNSFQAGSSRKAEQVWVMLILDFHHVCASRLWHGQGATPSPQEIFVHDSGDAAVNCAKGPSPQDALVSCGRGRRKL